MVTEIKETLGSSTITRENLNGECVCNSDYFLSPDGTACLKSCNGAIKPSGDANNLRYECPTGQTYNADDTSCSCADGEKYDSEAGRCLSGCPAYEYNGECVSSCASSSLFADIDGATCVS